MGDRVALGEFLKACRNRRNPDELGITASHGVRRTPGLRREEVAATAGVSVDYYTRLEQGRERNPSDAVLEALGRVLRLDEAEREHLFNVANHSRRRSVQRDDRSVRPSVLRLLETVGDAPAYLLTSTNHLLAANPPGQALLAGIEQWPPQRRNTLRYLFLHPSARSLFVQWHQVALNCVGHLRSVFGANPCDPEMMALIEEVSTKSEEFGAMWRRNEVQPKTSGTKLFNHPDVGRMQLQYETLEVSGNSAQHLVVYQAEPGTPDHDAMALLNLVAQRHEAERTGADTPSQDRSGFDTPS